VHIFCEQSLFLISNCARYDTLYAHWCCIRSFVQLKQGRVTRILIYPCKTCPCYDWSITFTLCDTNYNVLHWYLLFYYTIKGAILGLTTSHSKFEIRPVFRSINQSYFISAHVAP